MRFSRALAAWAATSLAAAYSSTPEYPPGSATSIEDFRSKHPYHPGCIPKGRRVVTLKPSRDDLDDVSDTFYNALREANHGGTVLLPKGQTFVIGKALELTFLDDVELRLDGRILFTNDIAYWQANAFKYPFQSAITFWKWGGKNVKIYGTGTLDGNGELWWQEFGNNHTTDDFTRPILFYGENLTDFQMEGIHMMNSPIWHQLYVTSTNISMTNLICTAEARNASTFPKNTDFFDSINVDQIKVKDIWVNIGDDCFSPKTNSTNIHVDTMYCNGTHGQSMGSIGQYAGEKSIIENVLIENIYLMNGNNGPRMKSWAGPDIGYGYINNITYRNMYLANSDIAGQLDSCYFNINATECAQYPSRVNVTNVTIENVQGKTSGSFGRVTAIFSCSTNPNAVCENIRLVNWNITSPCGEPTIVVCDGIKDGLGAVPCYSSTSDEAVAARKNTCQK
ncbi:exo-polygalacturonase [Thozetella sp. PMI_491]|nr:exo-polygalacturonase [Thozetella sp. PMI_491]